MLQDNNKTGPGQSFSGGLVPEGGDLRRCRNPAASEIEILMQDAPPARPDI